MIFSTKKQQIQKPRVKSFAFKGGLNTEISSMERPPGELSVCINYVEREGSYSGYQSLKGYERFDGRTSPASQILETYSDWANATGYVLNDRVEHGGRVFYCILAHTSATGVNEPDSSTPGNNAWWVHEGLVADVDERTDRKREALRTAITAVPGSGAIRGIGLYGNDVYAVRDNAGATAMAMYKSSTSGWVEQTAITGMTSAGGTCEFVLGRFSKWNANDQALLWIDGATDGVHAWNGTTYTHITDGLIVGTAPVNIGFWENRLFVVYPDGNVRFSQVGDPTAWDASTGYAGDINMGDSITDIVAASSVLVFFTKRDIQVLHYGSTTDQFIFKLDTFSKTQGAIEKTAQNLFETIYFCDDRGPSRMMPSAETGGFSAENIGEKIETEYLDNKDDITGTLLDRENRRYFVFYDNSDGTKSNGLAFTIHKKKLKGVGRFELEDRAVVAKSGVLDNGTNMMLFGDGSGFVYKMETGTSFDGELIATRLVTSYYHYGTPRHWKHFNRLGFEIACDSQTTFEIGVVFEYGSPLLARTTNQSQNVSGGGSTWGSAAAIWGSFTWGAGALGRAIHYLQGHGTNMAVVMITSSKYKTQHTIHNMTADYVIEGIRQ
jgi:hypothetical protein